MNDFNPAHAVADLATLEALYDAPLPASLAKEADHVHPHYRRLIEAAPFAVLATVGPDGLDASPRGDPAGFVRVQDEKTLLLPDRRGNNRIDSLKNILSDPRVALLFLLPGIGETLRVNGRASIHADPALLATFAIDGKLPRTVLKISVETVFFQCSRAILRSRLWDPAARIDRSALPSPGTILADLSQAQIDGAQYDAGLAARLKNSIY